MLGNAHEGTLPPFPAHVFTVPQYAYDTLNNGDNAAARSSFYCLEYMPSQMLRMGNNYASTYEFEDVPFHSMYMHLQSMHHLVNPFMDRYPSSWMQSTNINTVNRLQFRKANMAPQYRNWLPGPESLPQHKAHSKWMARDQMNKFNIDCRASAINPCMAQATSPDVSTFPVSGVLIFGKNGAPRTEVTRDQMMYRDEDKIWPTNPTAYNQWGRWPPTHRWPRWRPPTRS